MYFASLINVDVQKCFFDTFFYKSYSSLLRRSQMLIAPSETGGNIIPTNLTTPAGSNILKTKNSSHFLCKEFLK